MVHVARDHTTGDRGAAPSAPAGGQPAHRAPAEADGQQPWAAAGHAGRLRATLGLVWRDPRIAVGVAVLAAGGYGLLAAWWTPRGPVTTSQAVAVLAAQLQAQLDLLTGQHAARPGAVVPQ